MLFEVFLKFGPPKKLITDNGWNLTGDVMQVLAKRLEISLDWNWKIRLVYLNDILIFSKTFTDHVSHLSSVLSRLRHAHLTVNLRKCRFACDEVSFLGYCITPSGLQTDPAKVEAVMKFLSHSVKTRYALFRTIWLLPFLCPRFSQLVAPLNALLAKDAIWPWSSEHESAWLTLRTALFSAPVHRYPACSCPINCCRAAGNCLCTWRPGSHKWMFPLNCFHWVWRPFLRLIIIWPFRFDQFLTQFTTLFHIRL